MKNVLILCTGNSCRSIMAEALINHYLADKDIKAYSSGVAPSGVVNQNVIQVLTNAHIDTHMLSSKTLDTLEVSNFDLVVTVCDHAKEHCPIFLGSGKKIHCGYSDPSGLAYDTYVTLFEKMKSELLPIIVRELGV